MPSKAQASLSDVFPTYLLPSLPFRRRSSTDSNASTARSNSVSTLPGSPPNEDFLGGHASHLRCTRCLADLALATQIISKGFTGRHGRAYLVAPSASAITNNPLNLHTPKAKNDALPNLPNTFTHKPVPRQLVTGAHTVSDISCSQCGNNLGWKYIYAEEESQRYKVGKFILETKKVCRSSTWESDESVEDSTVSPERRRSSLPPSQLTNVPEDLDFDSQDEDECEDLFLGVWTPQLAAKRRRNKAT